MKKIMKPVEAAQYLGKSPQTLAQWRHYGIGPEYHKNGHFVFYIKSELDTWLKKSSGTTPPR